VVTEHATITYGDLDARANGLAHHLLASGLCAGETVAVVSARADEVMVGVLAAMKAGGAYTVLDPREPVGELGWLLTRAGAGTVVTHEEFGAMVAGLLDVDVRSPEPPDTPPGAVGAVLFTAGTTGERRVVGVGHAVLRAAYYAWAEVFALSPADRHLVTAPPDTVAFTGGWIRALCSGATLVVLPAGSGQWDNGWDSGWDAAGSVTVLDTDPVAAAALLEARSPCRPSVPWRTACPSSRS
jgi:non-ribosomal peptide synthetase component F